jgi:SulP family sulfate permease
MLTLIGLLRLGSLIRYISHAVTVGFTCGIAVTIFASQIKVLGRLKLPAPEPGQLLPKLAMLGQALPTIRPAAFAIGVGSAASIFLLRRLRPNWPGMLIAVVLASLAAWLFRLPVETIGSHFGQLPDGWPVPRFPCSRLH